VSDGKPQAGSSFVVRHRIVLVCALLAVSTAVLYAPVRNFDFIRFDDPRYVTQNEQISEGLTIEMVGWAATTIYKSNWHPLTWVSHALDVEFFGFDPGPHHVVNVVFHLANTLLVFALLYSLTGSLGRCAFVAGVFAFHPLHVESVAWVAERKDVLSSFFGLLFLLAYVRYARHAGVGRWLVVFVALTLGLMAKSMMVTLPFLFLLLDYWPLDRIRFSADGADSSSRRESLPPTRLVVEKLPFFALIAGVSVLTVWTQRAGGALHGSSIVAIPDRITNAAVAMSLYLGKTFWPTDLAVHYPHPNMPLAGGIPWSAWQIVASSLLFIAICVFVVLHRERRALFVGWCWFVGMLVPTIGLVQVGAQSHADRYVYLPMVGLAVAIVWGLGDWVVSWRRWPDWTERTLLPAALVVLAALWIASARHLPTWRTSETAFEQALAVSPTDTVMLNNLGNEMFDRGDFDSAIRYYRRALEIAPGTALREAISRLRSKTEGPRGMPKKLADGTVRANTMARSNEQRIATKRRAESDRQPQGTQ